MPQTPLSAPPARNFREAWKQFRRSKLAVAALAMLVALVLVAVFADLLANSRPLYARYNGSAHFPFLVSQKNDTLVHPQTGAVIPFSYSQVDWRTLPLESVVWAPVPYDPGYQDEHNRGLLSPLSEQTYLASTGEIRPIPPRFRHWLGVTRIGYDIASNLVHGARISLLVGFLSMAIAGLIGVTLGAMAGFYGNTGFRGSRGVYIALLLSIPLLYFYGFYVRRYAWQEALGAQFGAVFVQIVVTLAIMALILFVAVRLGRGLQRWSFFAKKVVIPIDGIVMRSIEILRAVPLLLVIIAFAAIMDGGIWFIITLIGLAGWTGIARVIRAEYLRIVKLEYMEAARALGYDNRRLLLRHALPNAIGPALVYITFGIGGAILAEAALSFLGIGVPASTEVLTWGKLLNVAKESGFQAWWVMVYPGLALFFTILSLNIIGERLRDVLDPRDAS